MTTSSPHLTLAVIKSAAVARRQGLNILNCVSLAGLQVHGLREGMMTPAKVNLLYGEHTGKVFWPDLYASVTDGPVIIFALSGFLAVQRWRNLLGATNPEVARPLTIRHDFGVKGADNAAHGSANPEDAARELAIFYEIAQINAFTTASGVFG